MTRHTTTPDDATFGLPLPLDGTKVEADANDLLDKNVLSICAPHVNPIKSSCITKAKSTPIHTRPRTKIQTMKMRLGKIMHKLDNLEPTAQPEKPLNIDLGIELYQMENL